MKRTCLVHRMFSTTNWVRSLPWPVWVSTSSFSLVNTSTWLLLGLWHQSRVVKYFSIHDSTQFAMARVSWPRCSASCSAKLLTMSPCVCGARLVCALSSSLATCTCTASPMSRSARGMPTRPFPCSCATMAAWRNRARRISSAPPCTRQRQGSGVYAATRLLCL